MLDKILDKVWKFFSSLKPAAFIFTALVLSTLLGSFIIQRNNAEEGQIERAYSPETVKIFEFFGFFDLFHSPWFVFLVFLLAVNVICASIEMAPRHIKLYKKIEPELSPDAMRNQRVHAEFDLPAGENAASFVRRLSEALKRRFAAPLTFEKDGKTFWHVNKMRWAYFGVYVVHLGLIVIMAGGIWGSVDGFEGQMALKEGESSDKVYVKNAVKRNKLLDFTVVCHDIRMDTYDNGSPKGYFSDLEVLNKDGKSVLRKTIKVNDPLVYGGIRFYQANYGKEKTNEQSFYALKMIDRASKKETMLRVPEDGSAFQIPGTNAAIEVTHYNENPVMPADDGQAVALGQTVRFIYDDGKKAEPVTAFKDYPELDEKLRPDAKASFLFVGLDEDFDLKEVTGLQVSRDPGAPVVFLGCGILMIGVFWTFFTSHQKIWAFLDGEKILIAGRTYRSQLGFQTKFDEMAGELKAGSEGRRAPESEPGMAVETA